MRRFSVLIIILLAGSLAIGATPAIANTTDPWAVDYTAWSHRTGLDISNPNSYTLTDFQVEVVLNSTWPGWAYVKQDGGDIRFALANGTPIPYYIESWNYTGQSATIWIKVPSIPAFDSVRAYIYFGNPDATSESNGTAVFDFFDDFDGTSLDTSKWTVVGTPTLTVSGGVLTFSTDSRGQGIKASYVPQSKVIIEMRYKWVNGTYWNHGIAPQYQDASNLYIVKPSTYDNSFKINKRVSAVDTVLASVDYTPPLNVWTINKVIYDPSTGNISGQITSDNGASAAVSATDTGLSGQSIGVSTWGNVNEVSEIDWIRVRKYADTEPTPTVSTTVEFRTPPEAPLGYYALNFGGNGYITAQGISSNELSVVVLFKATNLTGEHTLLDAREWGDSFGGWNLRVENSQVEFLTVWNDSGTYREASVATGISANRIYLVAAVHDGSTSYLYLNGNLAGSVAVNGLTENAGTTLYIGENCAGSGFFEGTMYMVLIYNRTLSDSEISQIYSDPLNPPTPGLVLWYSPDSVDTTNNVWLDKSGQANNGAIAGVTFERVSLPDVTAWDSVQNTPIPVNNLTITDTGGTVYIPWFLPLPYDVTVTLNVSAPGYYSTLYTVQAPVLSLNFTLTPIPTYATVAKGTAVVYARGGEKGGFLDFLNLFKFWPGGDIGAKFMRLDIKGALETFFNDTTIPFLGAIVAVIIWASGVILAWVYSGEPEFVALWGLALYLGFSEFITLDEYLKLFNAVMVPFALVISILYLKKALDTFGGG